MADGAFQNVRVIEFGHAIAVPACCAILADWGADVIRVEFPQGGDQTRGVFALEQVVLADSDPRIWYEQINRNKRATAIDLRTDSGRKVLHKLVEHADVFATNYRVALLDEVGADYETLSRINPKLVYALFTGYGTAGPDKDEPGFDYTAFWARSGIMDRVSEPGAAPRPVRPGLGDNLSSGYVVSAISAALFCRERTGLGQKVELSLYQVSVWGMNWDIEPALQLGQEINRTDRTKVNNPLWNCYRTKDDHWIQIVMIQTDRYFPVFCKAVGRDDWLNDSKFDSHEKRMQQNMTLIPMMDELFASKTKQEWIETFRGHDVVYGFASSPLDVVKDPQAWANEFFVEVDHPLTGRIKYVASPVRFSKTPACVRSCAPELGQHTEEVLLEHDYTWDDISELKRQGAIL